MPVRKHRQFISPSNTVQAEFQSSFQLNLNNMWNALLFLELSQKEGLGLLVSPEEQVTSAIVSQSQGRQRRKQEGSAKQTETLMLFIRSHYTDCL